MIRMIRQRVPLTELGWLRLAVIAGLLVGLLVIGVATTRVPLEMVMAAAVVPPVLILTLTGSREYGVLAIILAAGFVRFSLPTGTESRIVISLLVTGVFIALWVARMLMGERRLRLSPSNTTAPLLAFIITAVISYGWSNVFRDPLVIVWKSWPFVQLGGLAVLVLLPGAFLLTVNTISEVRWLKLLFGSIILIGVLSLADYLLPVSIPFLNTGGLFSLWFVSLAYAQALFNGRLSHWARLALLIAVLIWIVIYFVVRVTWLSGWLPSLAALVVISLLKSRKLFLIVLLLIAIYVGLNWEYYSTTVWAAERAESGETRLSAWLFNWQVTRKHFLFGTGPAGYAVYYMSYFPGQAMATHSNYVDVLSQMGIVGLLFCLWFFAALAWTGYRLCMRLRGTSGFGEGFAVAGLAGCIGCIIAMGLGDWMFPFVYTQTIAGFDYAVYSWVLLGGMVALSNMDVSDDMISPDPYAVAPSP